MSWLLYLSYQVYFPRRFEWDQSQDDRMNDKEFVNFKKQVLQNPDASKKGNIDAPIKPVIDIINAHPNYVTLSSCSGRTSVVVQSSDVEIQKEGCQWAYCTHDFADPNELLSCVYGSLDKGQLTLKFEPFILHVACQSLEDAKRMLNCALQVGCKNSGMVVGKRDRYTVAVRNTLQMEVPLTREGHLLVSNEEHYKMMQMGGMPGGPPMGPQMQPQTVVGQPPMVGPPQPPPQAQEKLDNISKVKSLMGQLSNSLNTTLKTAAHNLFQNCLVDTGTSKNVDIPPPRFDKSLEEFYSICDQIELHLKTSIECLNQGKSNQTYLNLQVAPTRSEPIPNQDMNTLTYPQYLATVRTQVNFAKELHDMLLAAAQNIASAD